MFKKGLLLLSLLFLAACGTKNVMQTQEISECNYPDTPDSKAPLWVCGAPIEGVAISTVGIVEKTKAGVNFMIQQATANARVILAQQINSDVQAMVKNFVETTGEGDTETIDKVTSLTSKVITNQSLSGTKVFRQITSPRGTLYVVVGFDNKTYEGYIKQQLATSYTNEKAQWQKTMSDKSFSEMENSIATSISSR